MQTDDHRYWNEKNAKGQSLSDELLEIRRAKSARSGARGKAA